MTLEPDIAVELYKRELPAALDVLRKGEVVKHRRAFTTGAQIIKQFATRDWQLKPHTRSGFQIKTSQNTILLNEADFGAMMAKVSRKVLESEDSSVASALETVLDGTDGSKLIVRWTLVLFLAHEFFHSEQMLDSDTYADSDDFTNIVSAADYQADIVGIDYAFRCIRRTFPIDHHHAVLLLLIFIHISVMQVFSPSAEKLSMGRAAFDRLLLWHLQAARVAAAKSCPEATHGSLATMPAIALPGLETRFGSKVEWAKVQKGLGKRSYQLVLGLSRADYVIRIQRLQPTLNNRVPELVRAVLAEDFMAFRDNVEEFFKTHEDICRFDEVAPQYARPLLQNCVQQMSALAFRAASTGALLSFADQDVEDSFEQIVLLIDREEVPEGIWANARDEIERLRNLSRSARTKAKRAEASAAILKQISYIEVRLSLTLDQLGG